MDTHRGEGIAHLKIQNSVPVSLANELPEILQIIGGNN
jgi:hypothetical protein